MNKNLYILLFIFSFTISTLNIESKNIYVSLQGNDNNNGKIETPFKTIARGINEAKENDTIFIREGIYSITKSLSFHKAQNIVLQSYRNEMVSLCGGVEINSKSIKTPNKTIKSKLNKNAKEKIRYIDFTPLNINISSLTKKGYGHTSGPSWNELFINDEPLTIARWPNNKMILLDSIINNGNIISKKITDKGYASFKYKNPQPDKWESANDVWISGYFGEGWGDELLPIKFIDKTKKTITVGSDSFYGFKSGKSYLRWYACNIIGEIDEPNEYYIDKTQNRIYFYPPNRKIKNIKLSTLTTPILSLKSCNNITIKNITIECTRGMGILVENSSNTIIDNCIIKNIGHIGIKTTGTQLYDNKIQNCTLYNIGSYGIILDGGNRNKLIAGNCIVNNCRINNFSRIEHSYKPAIEINGCGNKISHVELFDAPSMAILLHGNNHTIEYANIHHVCKEVHDQSAFYYGRNPTERGHTIRYSYFHDIQSPFDVRATYHDDGACGMTVHGCIFNNISSTPVQIGGGQDIIYTNNIFMNLPSAITIDARLKTWANKWIQQGGDYDKKFRAVNYAQPPFSEAYPEMTNYWNDDPTTPKRNVISNNIFYNVKNIIVGKREYLVWKKNWETIKNPGFKNPSNPLDGINYQFIRQHLPEFQEIPLERIGCNL